MPSEKCSQLACCGRGAHCKNNLRAAQPNSDAGDTVDGTADVPATAVASSGEPVVVVVVVVIVDVMVFAVPSTFVSSTRKSWRNAPPHCSAPSSVSDTWYRDSTSGTSSAH